MSRIASKEAVFQEIALAHFRGKQVTIDEVRETCEAEGFWTEDELAGAVREWKNAQLRRLARKRFVDEDGNSREIVNFERQGASPAESQHVFGFLDETTQEDLEWVIRDRLKKVEYFRSEIDRLLDVYGERFGKRARKKFQGRLNLDFAADG